MDFISNQKPQIDEMLKSMGLSNIEALWECIPEKIRLKAPLEDDGLSEYEAQKDLLEIGEKNTYLDYESYLGAGAYAHYVPALVRSIMGKSGFLTAYTPYQGEASQGMLQTIYEFQTCVSRLTGLKISNASLYDGASACGEALLMASRLLKDRNQVLVSKSLHPHYQAVSRQYVEASNIEYQSIPITKEGLTDHQAYKEMLTEQVSAVLLPYPNFFGNIEEIKPLFEAAKEKGIITILCANPLAYGLYESAAELGADIAVGDCQPFGISLQLGGPYAGYLSCHQKFARQIPGRVVGRTHDREGHEGFVLTLQTREQHIRREKATSNICSNQALYALASLVGMLWYGPHGMQELALTNFQRASYLKERLAKLNGVTLLNDQPILNEFTIQVEGDLSSKVEAFKKHQIIPGLELGKYCPHLKNSLLVNVTELKSKAMLDRYLKVAEKVL